VPEIILCKICGKRRARRACPVVAGDICPLCCGTEREVTLTCPLECEYLAEAHRREKPMPLPDGQLANPDINITEEFIRSHEEFLLFCVFSLVQAALQTWGAVDSDVIDALQALIQTHRTLESGLYYESRAQNTVAARIQRSFEASLADYQKLRTEREHLSPVRNVEILAVLVFLHRLAQHNQNGRPRGRMYLDLLRRMTPEMGVEAQAPSIIL
jgi:hypothetical protein